MQRLYTVFTNIRAFVTFQQIEFFLVLAYLLSALFIVVPLLITTVDDHNDVPGCLKFDLFVADCWTI